MSTAMVWGAGGGIGRALIDRLVREGRQVVAVSRHVDGLHALTPLVFQADPADEFAAQQAVMAAAQEIEQVDLWIYAAGDIMAAKSAETSAQEWTRILNANLTGAVLSTIHSLPLLAPDAQLLYLGAVHQRLQLPRYGAYATAKAGLETFAAVLAKEERKRRVAVLRPAAVDTSLWDKVPLRLPAAALSPAQAAEAILALAEKGVDGVIDIP